MQNKCSIDAPEPGATVDRHTHTHIPWPFCLAHTSISCVHVRGYWEGEEGTQCTMNLCKCDGVTRRRRRAAGGALVCPTQCTIILHTHTHIAVAMCLGCFSGSGCVCVLRRKNAKKCFPPAGNSPVFSSPCLPRHPLLFCCPSGSRPTKKVITGRARRARCFSAIARFLFLATTAMVATTNDNNY